MSILKRENHLEIKKLVAMLTQVLLISEVACSNIKLKKLIKVGNPLYFNANGEWNATVGFLKISKFWNSIKNIKILRVDFYTTLNELIAELNSISFALDKGDIVPSLSSDNSRIRFNGVQPVYLSDNSRIRFKSNELVRYILDSKDIKLGDLFSMPFSEDDKQHFLQLLGHSLAGYTESAYANAEIIKLAEKQGLELS